MNAVFAVVVVVSVLLASVMGASCGRKFLRAEQSEGLRRRLGLGRPLWLSVGALELGAAAGLLVGLVDGRIGLAAAAGTALLMLGALAAHLRVRVAGPALVPPLVVLALALAGAAAALQTGAL